MSDPLSSAGQDDRETIARLRTALERIAEYDTDWTKGPAENVAALQAIAESALASPASPTPSTPPVRCPMWSGSASGYPWQCTDAKGHEGKCTKPDGHYTGPADKL